MSCLEGGEEGEGREERTAASFNTMIHELIGSVGEGEGGWCYYAHICIKPTVSGTVSLHQAHCQWRRSPQTTCLQQALPAVCLTVKSHTVMKFTG